MGAALKRTTIFLTEEQHEKLRQLAFEQRTSMAKLLRDAALEIMKRTDGTYKESKSRGEWI